LSIDSQIDKDRLLFTQNNSPIRLRCPECVRTTKILRHCRIFKNLPSLWWHIKRDHGNFANLLFDADAIVTVLGAISKAKEWGIIPEPTPVYVEPTTTSSSILIDGRPPRTDMLEKLEKIGILLKLQSEIYPKFKPKLLSLILEQILGPVVPRTKKKYIDCITRYSKKDKIRGLYDVTEFCENLGL